MSFATLREMAGWRKLSYDQKNGFPKDAPPQYQLNQEDTLKPRTWAARHWGWGKWAGVVAGLVIVVVIIAVAAVEVEKKNAYPDYSALSYTLADTCKLLFRT